MKPTTTQRQVDNLVYLDDYLDTIEALPLELQRNFTLMRELDGYAQDFMESVASESIAFIDKVKTMASEERIKKLREIANLLSETLKRGEEKVALAKSTYDTVDRHCTRLDTDIQKFEDEQIGAGRTSFLISPSKSKEEIIDKKKGPEKSKDTRTEKRTTAMVADTTPLKKRKTKDVGSPPPSTRATTPKDKGTTSSSSKTKGTTKSSEKDKAMVENSREKAKKTSALATDMPIDPNEPLYCYCQQVSYGEMVACDNEDCDIEWFHLGCTELKGVPKGKWYCRNCAPMVKEKSRQKK